MGGRPLLASSLRADALEYAKGAGNRSPSLVPVASPVEVAAGNRDVEELRSISSYHLMRETHGAVCCSEFGRGYRAEAETTGEAARTEHGRRSTAHPARGGAGSP